MFDLHGFTCPVPHILLPVYAVLGLKPRALCRLDEQSTKLLMSPALFVLLISPHVARLASNLLQTCYKPEDGLQFHIFLQSCGTQCMKPHLALYVWPYAHTSACMSRPEGDGGSLSQLLFILVSDKTQWTWSSPIQVDKLPSESQAPFCLHFSSGGPQTGTLIHLAFTRELRINLRFFA